MVLGATAWPSRGNRKMRERDLVTGERKELTMLPTICEKSSTLGLQKQLAGQGMIVPLF